MDKIKRLLPTILVIIFEIAVGIMLLIDGEKLTGIIFIIFGVVVLVMGIVGLIMALVRGKTEGSIPMHQVFISIILIAVGGFFAAASGSVAQVVTSITIIYGIILVINGVFKLADYFAFKKSGSLVNGFVVFNAIISIIFGFVIAFNPFGTAVVLWTVLGIALLVFGIMDIISLIIYGKAVRELKEQ